MVDAGEKNEDDGQHLPLQTAVRQPFFSIVYRGSKREMLYWMLKPRCLFILFRNVTMVLIRSNVCVVHWDYC